MELDDRAARIRLDSPEGEAALRSLTLVERYLCRRLIARQFAHRRDLSRDLANYGLEGMVRICAATAMRVYLVPVALIAVVLAVAGLSAAAIAAFGLLAAGSILVIARFSSASRSGQEWRRTNAAPEARSRAHERR